MKPGAQPFQVLIIQDYLQVSYWGDMGKKFYLLLLLHLRKVGFSILFSNNLQYANQVNATVVTRRIISNSISIQKCIRRSHQAFLSFILFYLFEAFMQSKKRPQLPTSARGQNIGSSVFKQYLLFSPQTHREIKLRKNQSIHFDNVTNKLTD